MSRLDRTTVIEATLVVALALALYLPFLAIQYDTNGIVEAASLEAGQLVNKNHILYRLVGLVVYRVAESFGYRGNSLFLLQILNAICGAVGIGLAYALFKSATRNRAAAAVGAFWLATSFSYWMFSTDVAYITMAAVFALGAIVCIVFSSTPRSLIVSGILASLSILTWQASVFLVPLLVVLVFVGNERPAFRHSVLLILTIGLTAGIVYVVTAFTHSGVMGPAAFWKWFTNYSEEDSLPLWGVWDASRIATAAGSALRSMLPVLLAVPPTEITRGVQLGRLAVDVALIATGLLVILALWKAQTKSLLYLFGYALFLPFIIWWDPFEPKWFLIPNIFLAGFLSCGLQDWMSRKRTALVVVLCVLGIGATNFITTIRPRHSRSGVDRDVAQCVAGHMKPQDAVVAAEWGWPDYLEYLHSRVALNVINVAGHAGTHERITRVKEFIASTQQSGGDVYIADPHADTPQHLAWLAEQTGVTLDDLNGLGGSPSFECSGRVVLKVPSAITRN